MQYYFVTLNYLKASGDGSATRTAAEAGCRPCNAMIHMYQKTNVTNAGINGDYAWRDVKVSSAKITDSNTAQVTVAARQGKYMVKAKPTGPVQTVAPKDFALKLTLSAKGNRWVTFDLELESDK